MSLCCLLCCVVVSRIASIATAIWRRLALTGGGTAALKYGVQPAEIKRLNKLFAPTLFAGTVLKLPAAAARTHIHALPPASAGATQVTITDARPKAEAEWVSALTPRSAPYLTRLGLYACNVRQVRTLTFAFVLNQAVGAIPRQAEHTPRVIDTAIIDTATVWDGEAGFMSLTADRDMDKDCGGVAGEDLPCTWVGSLFSPQHDCLLTGLALNLRVVDGESLAFRVIVTEWIPTTLAAAGPAATPPDQGRGTSLHQAQDHVCNAGGGPGAVLFYSRVLHIQRQHAEDPVWARIDDALTQTHGQSVRVPAGQTVLLGVCTECVAQEPPVATASTQGEGVDGQHEVGGSLGQVQVGYVRSRACSEAVGGVLQKLVWLHGCVGGSMPWVVAGGGESREVGEQEVHRRAMCQTRPAVGAFECADHALALTLTTVLVDSYGETETRSRGDFGGALGRLDFSPTREQPTCGEDPVDGAQVGISEEGRVEMHKGLASVGPTSGASDEENVWGPERESLCLRRQLTAMGIDVADAPLLLGRDDEGTLCGITSDILAYPDEILRIREACPVRCGLRDWELLYSTKRHGLSMNTFFRQVQGRRDSVLVIKDSGGHVFGAFIPFAWKQSSTFYGSGESFVLAVKPTWTQYRWSRQNSMFAITNPKGIMIGGGGSPAIWLDGDFNQGTSGPCMTYNSRCLCARGNGMGEGSTAFTCIHMEVWAAMQDVQFGQHVQLRHRLLEQMTSDRVLSYLRNLRRQVNANREGGDGVNVESLVLHGAGLQGEGSEGRESQPVGFLEHEMEAHEADHEGVEAENIARENSPVTGGAVAGGTVAAGGTLSSAMSMLRSAMGFRFGGGAKQSDGKGGKQNDVGSISKVAGMSLRSFSISKPFGVVPAGATTGQLSGINEEKAGTGDSTRAAGSERAQRDADETGVALFERPPSLQTPDGLNLVVQDRVASSRVQEPGVQEGQQGLQSGAHDGVRGNFNAGVEGQGEGNCVVDDAAAAEGKETPTKPNATASSSALQRWSEIMVYLPDSVAGLCISCVSQRACTARDKQSALLTTRYAHRYDIPPSESCLRAIAFRHGHDDR